MSQVDYEQKIREIKKLKISDEEKSRRIHVRHLQQVAKVALESVKSN